jgi:hypothetical protein
MPNTPGGIMTLTAIKGVSTLERIQTMELLWDSLILNENEIKSPAWHEQILKKRKHQLESGETRAIPLSRLKSLLRK